MPTNALAASRARQALADLHRAFADRLTAGVPADELLPLLRPVIDGLEELIADLTRPDRGLPEGECALRDDLDGLHGTLVTLRDKAAAPPRPDWLQIEEAQAAFARGEGKRFQGLARSHTPNR